MLYEALFCMSCALYGVKQGGAEQIETSISADYLGEIFGEQFFFFLSVEFNQQSS
jgi:hypothetical protein